MQIWTSRFRTLELEFGGIGKRGTSWNWMSESNLLLTSCDLNKPSCIYRESDFPSLGFVLTYKTTARDLNSMSTLFDLSDVLETAPCSNKAHPSELLFVTLCRSSIGSRRSESGVMEQGDVELLPTSALKSARQILGQDISKNGRLY